MKNKQIKKAIISIFTLLITIVISNICYGAEEITSNEYKLTQVEGTNCILGIYQNTRAKVLKENITAESIINIYDKTGKSVEDNELVKTGDTIKIGDETYTAIVCGDINGDGNVTITDLSKIKSHLVGLEEQAGASKIASDIDINGKITSTDILNIKRLIVRIIEEREIFEQKYIGTEYGYKKNTLTDKITITSIIEEKASEILRIPDKVDGNEVKQIEGFLGESSKVKTVIIPSEIESIGRTSFSGLTNLEAIEVSKLNENYSSEDGILYNKEQDEIVYYPRGKQETQITIKETISKIGEYAFYKNNSIKKLYIPDTVEELAKNSFEEMQGKVYVKEDSNIISELKAQEISYETDAKPKITKLTSQLGTNQKMTLNIEATDDVGIVAWGVINKGGTNIEWQNVAVTKKLTTTYEGIIQNGTYEVNVKDNVGNIGTQEIIINEIDETIPRVTSIKIVTPTSGEYKAGEVITIRVEFSENIKGTAPELKLEIGTTIVTATATTTTLTGTVNYIDYTYLTTNDGIGKVEIYSYSGGKLTDANDNEANIQRLANSGSAITIKSNETNKGGFKEGSFRVSSKKEIPYYIYIPDLSLVGTYKDIPLIVSLHMAGIGTLDGLITNESIAKYIYNKQISPKAIVVMPVCYSKSKYVTEMDIDPMMTFIESIAKSYDVNKDKISIVGHSQGARHALRIAKAAPNYFSACVLFSWVENGTYKHDMQTEPMPTCQTRFVYEDRSSVNYNRNIVIKLSQKYKNISLQNVPNVGHENIVKACKTTNIIQWIIAQTR